MGPTVTELLSAFSKNDQRLLIERSSFETHSPRAQRHVIGYRQARPPSASIVRLLSTVLCYKVWSRRRYGVFQYNQKFELTHCIACNETQFNCSLFVQSVQREEHRWHGNESLCANGPPRKFPQSNSFGVFLRSKAFGRRCGMRIRPA